MAPGNRLHSHDKPSKWLQELLAEIRGLRHDFSQHELNIRDIRSIVLENQNTLRTHARTNSSPINRLNNNSRSSPTIVSSQFSKSTFEKALRNTAVPIPRPTIPNPDNVPRVCWYHKQFGAASAHFIQPCSFVAPEPIIPKAKTTTKEKLRPVRPLSTDTTDQPVSLVKGISIGIRWSRLKIITLDSRLSDSLSSSSSSSPPEESQDEK